MHPSMLPQRMATSKTFSTLIMKILVCLEYFSARPLTSMAINFYRYLISKKPFIGMAFLFFGLFSAVNGLSQSSADFLRTTNTERGKIHFIKPLEFNPVES